MSRQRQGDREWLQTAIDLSRACPPVNTAYAVGAVLVDGAGRELARGYSRESDPCEHAEEAALAKLRGAGDLSDATFYSSMEPCSVRRSRPLSCARLIIAAGVGRVVLGLREPSLFVRCEGVKLLRRAGVEVVQLPELADQVLAINSHLVGLGRPGQTQWPGPGGSR